MTPQRTLQLIGLMTLCACTRSATIVEQSSHEPAIYPDYKGVCVPYNMAPLNFVVTDTTADRLLIRAGDDELTVEGDGRNGFDIDTDRWHDLLASHRGQTMTFTLCRRTDGGLAAYAPFEITISEDDIDPCLVYRLIPPGYAMWNRMSITQRNLETFDEEHIYENRYGQGNCVNCHSFCGNDAGRMLFHIRKRHGGTFIFIDGRPRRLGADMSAQLSNPVYPYWHPGGRYVAFSTNKTFQLFHSSDANRIEVADDASDIVVYDVEADIVLTDSLIASADAFETFPCFSPDGTSLYFASAKAVDGVETNYKSVKYSICRIGFDPEHKTFGTSVDTLYNARLGGRSAVFPRVSPDGRLLVFTLSDYSTFPVWHRDADLYCIELASGTTRALTEANSDDTESYHSWSSNGRWLVFGSRRDDGLYTRPYFTHIDAGGNATKPLMLPQRSPRDYYLMQNNSYNIPELVKSRIDLNGRETYEALKRIW